MKFKLALAAIVCLSMISCSQNAVEEVKEEVASDKGIGPIKSVVLGEIDQAMAKEGETLFNTKCAACHKMDKRYIGPPLAGIMERRTPEWIMNMIMNPEEMVMKDPAARQLLMEYSAPMANQSLTEDETRKILEFFRVN